MQNCPAYLLRVLGEEIPLHHIIFLRSFKFSKPNLLRGSKNLFGPLLGKNIIKQKHGEKKRADKMIKWQMVNLKSYSPCLPNPCSITGQPFLGAWPSAWVVLHQKVDFHKFVLNLCQPRGIYCNLKAHLSIKKISAEVWKCYNGHNTWKECWYHMTTHNSEVCVVVSHLGGGAHVKNQNASLQISVYVFTLYFVKMDVRRCQKSKT